MLVLVQEGREWTGSKRRDRVEVVRGVEFDAYS